MAPDKVKVDSIVEEFFKKPAIVILTVIFTVGFGLGLKLFDEGSAYHTFCDIGFYVALSMTLIEILAQLHALNKASSTMHSNTKDTNTIHKNVMQIKDHSPECIVCSSVSAKISEHCNNMLQENKITSGQIICYGTNKYGGLVSTIKRDYPNVEVEIIVCSPTIDIINNKDDEKSLRTAISNMKSSRKVTVYESKIPPTIRASLFYYTDKNNGIKRPVFCALQTYHLQPDAPHLMGYENSPAILAREENGVLLREMEIFFLKEFERLKKESFPIPSAYGTDTNAALGRELVSV